jgi:Phosphotransferase enzyme family
LTKAHTLVDQREVVPYLLDRTLISYESIIKGDLIVQDLSRRNRNFRVVCRDGPSYLIKQGVTAEGLASVAREAELLFFMNQTFDPKRMREYVPSLRDYDADTGVLVLDLISGAIDLRHYHSRTGRFAVTPAKGLGTALGWLHGNLVASSLNWSRRFFLPPPWALSIHMPTLEALPAKSQANVQLIKLVQFAAELCEQLSQLKSGWTESAFIHGDLKWDNCLSHIKPGASRRNGLAIVDWETAGFGDPCWDVGSAFCDYLAFWVLSIPVTADASLSRLPEMASYPLKIMHPALRSFWHAYTSTRGLRGSAAIEQLLWSLRFTAARLVQTAFEQMQMRTELTGSIVAMVQLAQNIMKYPFEAAHSLLCLDGM